MSKTYLPYEPDQQLLLPAALQEWLPDDHLAYFMSRGTLPVSYLLPRSTRGVGTNILLAIRRSCFGILGAATRPVSRGMHTWGYPESILWDVVAPARLGSVLELCPATRVGDSGSNPGARWIAGAGGQPKEPATSKEVGTYGSREINGLVRPGGGGRPDSGQGSGGRRLNPRQPGRHRDPGHLDQGCGGRSGYIPEVRRSCGSHGCRCLGFRLTCSGWPHQSRPDGRAL